VQALAESLGGRVDISSVEDADGEAVAIVFALPASAA
jgi:hypothetical protein